MPNTGPDKNTYNIPPVNLGDNFNFWRDATNTSSYKLNLLKSYKGVTSSTNFITTNENGEFSCNLNTFVGGTHEFNEDIVFKGGVTFDGDVTFNAQTFTVNSNIVTIDDYAIVLGAGATASDTAITTFGGGGIKIDRGLIGEQATSRYANWLWMPVQDQHGNSGAWTSDSNIGFVVPDGDPSLKLGITPINNQYLYVHGKGVILDGTSTFEHGLRIGFTGGGSILGPIGTDGNSQQNSTTFRSIEFVRTSPDGATAFMHIITGDNTTPFNKNPITIIADGVNRKTIHQQEHGIPFGTPVRLQYVNDNSPAVYVASQADTDINSEVVGIVSRIIDANSFELTFIGEIFGDFAPINRSGTALTPASTYYLDPFTAGIIRKDAPTELDQVYKGLLIATSPTSAVVLPWTGGVMGDDIIASNATSVSTRISQLNKFVVGDVLRWRKATVDNNIRLDYSWALPGGSTGTTGATYTHGIYCKADANSAINAEVIGVVIGSENLRDANENDTGINSSFDLLMDGYFKISGITALNAGASGPLVSGSVYYLNSGSAGITQSFESSVPSLTTVVPTASNSIKKSVLQATTNQSGHVFSYAGVINGNPGISASDVITSELLINDLRPTTNADIKFLVNWDGPATLKEVMRFPSTAQTVGNVGIGNWSTGPYPSATLDVSGPIRAGIRNSNGGIILSSNSTVPTSGTVQSTETYNTFGYKFTTGNSPTKNTVIGFNCAPNSGSAGYKSTVSQSSVKSALELGVSGGVIFFGIMGATQNGITYNEGITLFNLFTVNARSGPDLKILQITPNGNTLGGNTGGAGDFYLTADCNASINGMHISAGQKSVADAFPQSVGGPWPKYTNTSVGVAALNLLNTSSSTSGWNMSANDCTAVGIQALKSNLHGSSNTAFGAYSLSGLQEGAQASTPSVLIISHNTSIGSASLKYSTNSAYSTAIGSRSMQLQSTLVNASAQIVLQGFGGGGNQNNTAVGYEALHGRNFYVQNGPFNNGSYNTAVGCHALYNIVGNAYMSALGYNAGRYKVAGGAGGSGGTHQSYIAGQTYTPYGTLLNNPSAFASADANVTCIGANSKFSGKNQVVLGDGQADVYTPGASVHALSDLRDKADVRNTILGLTFLLQLRPVDYRWNKREDYTDIEYFEVEDSRYREKNINGEWVERIRYRTDQRQIFKENDGSRKRTRYHHGLIAQEVKEVMTQNNIDFAGYQDHSVSGGADVLTLGYEELIAPLIKAIQELNARIQQLENNP